jgi:hypothetical protein
MTSSQTRLEGLPSWCPDFNSSDETYRELLSHYHAGWSRRPPVDRGTELPIQAMQKYPKVKCRDSNYVTTFAFFGLDLSLGCIADTVQLLGRLIEFAFSSNLYKVTRPGSGTWYQRVLAWLDSILGLLHTVSDHDLPDCYWRALVGDYDIVTLRFPTNPAQIEL